MRTRNPASGTGQRLRIGLVAGALALTALVTGGPEAPPAVTATTASISAPPSTSVPPQRPQRLVHLLARGVTVDLQTAAPTVAQFLADEGFDLTGARVEPAPDTPITPGLQVRVVQEEVRTVTERSEIPFTTERVSDPALPAGEKRVVQAGQPGMLERVRRLVFEDGVQVAERIVSDAVVKPAVPAVVAFGTMNLLSRGGESHRYSQVLTMKATGYTAGKESNPEGTGHTYTGRRAVRGIAAVDPGVIPLHTRLYVEGYGYAEAEDIGGAIQGNRIDLVFDTVPEALQWGVREVTVYVLE